MYGIRRVQGQVLCEKGKSLTVWGAHRSSSARAARASLDSIARSCASRAAATLRASCTRSVATADACREGGYSRAVERFRRA